MISDAMEMLPLSLPAPPMENLMLRLMPCWIALLTALAAPVCAESPIFRPTGRLPYWTEYDQFLTDQAEDEYYREKRAAAEEVRKKEEWLSEVRRQESEPKSGWESVVRASLTALRFRYHRDPVNTSARHRSAEDELYQKELWLDEQRMKEIARYSQNQVKTSTTAKEDEKDKWKPLIPPIIPLSVQGSLVTKVNLIPTVTEPCLFEIPTARQQLCQRPGQTFTERSIEPIMVGMPLHQTTVLELINKTEEKLLVFHETNRFGTFDMDEFTNRLLEIKRNYSVLTETGRLPMAEEEMLNRELNYLDHDIAVRAADSAD